MPSVKDFEKKQSKAKEDASATTSHDSSTGKGQKRRPGRDEVTASDADVKVVEVEQEVEQKMEQNSSNQTQAAPAATAKVEISFKGSEMLRAKFPKPFELAEQVATDWVHDGQFEALPLGHPLAQVAAQKGLQKAKQIEKKVLTSPVTEKLAMQVLTAGMKAQTLINEIRSKIKKK